MRKVYRYSLFCFAVILLISLISCSFITDIDDVNSPSPGGHTDVPEDPGVSPTPELPPEPEGTTSVKLRTIGDIIMHMGQINAGKKPDGTRDYRHFFDDIKPYLEGADIVMGNLETTISNDEIGYSGYPMFKAPEELLDALVYAGFNVITTANNHSFDGREFGVINTLDKLDEYGLMHTGTARTEEEQSKVLLIDKNDIKTAILAYTYGTNGMEVTIPAEKRAYMVNLIDKDRIKQDVESAREAGAEILVVSIHWGDEYARTPNTAQKEMADYLASLGVDIIMGSHPHVLQPMEKRKVTMEDGSVKDVFLIYSLGNFVSNQQWQYADSGVIIELDIVKDYDKDEIRLENVAYTPTWVYRWTANGKYDYRVLPVGQFLDEELGGAAEERIDDVWNETTSHLGEEGFIIKE